VKIPSTEPTAAGCEKLLPFRITAEKQAIWVWEEFENIRSIADPSKSGITNAIGIILETSDDETGIMAPPIMGILLFSGHRLLLLDFCCAPRA
jgi:hypothetical protein